MTTGGKKKILAGPDLQYRGTAESTTRQHIFPATDRKNMTTHNQTRQWNTKIFLMWKKSKTQQIYLNHLGDYALDEYYSTNDGSPR